MRASEESGFSIIELLIVVVVAGVIAAIAVPSLQKGIRAAENGAVYATLRTISSSQVSFYSHNNRFARITELNTAMGGSVGVNGVNRVVRGSFVFETSPIDPSDTELKNGFVLFATRSLPDDVVHLYKLTETGEITRLLP